MVDEGVMIAGITLLIQITRMTSWTDSLGLTLMLLTVVQIVVCWAIPPVSTQQRSSIG